MLIIINTAVLENFKKFPLKVSHITENWRENLSFICKIIMDQMCWKLEFIKNMIF